MPYASWWTSSSSDEDRRPFPFEWETCAGPLAPRERFARTAPIGRPRNKKLADEFRCYALYVYAQALGVENRTGSLLPRECYAESMHRGRRAVRQWLSAGLLGLLFVPFPWSCQRRPAPPVAAPPPNYYQLGESAFEAGDYAQAIEAYGAYLRTTPGGSFADRVLFRMAMAYLLPESPERDTARAADLLGDLILHYPASPFKPPAELVLLQQSELRLKQSELEAQQLEVERLLADLGNRKSEIQSLTQELEQIRHVELEGMRVEVARREERIRQLAEELEQLKRIDLRRRPAAPLP